MIREHLLVQSRRLGALTLGLPVAVGLAVAGLGWVTSVLYGQSRAVLLTLVSAQLFVLAAGLCATLAFTGDPLVELHEATENGFRYVQELRAVLVSLWSVAGSLAMVVLLRTLGIWSSAGAWSVITPAAAALALVGVALFAAAWQDSPAAVATTVIASWLFLSMLWDPYVRQPVVGRGVPVVVAAVMVWASRKRMSDPEKSMSTWTSA